MLPELLPYAIAAMIASAIAVAIVVSGFRAIPETAALVLERPGGPRAYRGRSLWAPPWMRAALVPLDEHEVALTVAGHELLVRVRVVDSERSIVAARSLVAEGGRLDPTILASRIRPAFERAVERGGDPSSASWASRLGDLAGSDEALAADGLEIVSAERAA